MSGSVESGLSRTFSGSSSNGVVIHYMAGAASLVAGTYLLIKKS